MYSSKKKKKKNSSLWFIIFWLMFRGTVTYYNHMQHIYSVCVYYFACYEINVQVQTLGTWQIWLLNVNYIWGTLIKCCGHFFFSPFYLGAVISQRMLSIKCNHMVQKIWLTESNWKQFNKVDFSSFLSTKQNHFYNQMNDEQNVSKVFFTCELTQIFCECVRFTLKTVQMIRIRRDAKALSILHVCSFIAQWVCYLFVSCC